MATETHYTAVLTIHETTEVVEDKTVTAYDRRVQVAQPPKRESTEHSKVVVRADSLDALREKIAAHAALL